MSLRLLLLAIIVIVFALLQGAGFSIWGAKINLSLAAVIIIAAFFKKIEEELLMMGLAILFLKFGAGFDKSILIFSLIGAAAVIGERYLPWRHFINGLFLIILSSLLFYLLLEPTLILSTIFIKELIFNLMAGGLIFVVINKIIKYPLFADQRIS